MIINHYDLSAVVDAKVSIVSVALTIVTSSLPERPHRNETGKMNKHDRQTMPQKEERSCQRTTCENIIRRNNRTKSIQSIKAAETKEVLGKMSGGIVIHACTRDYSMEY